MPAQYPDHPLARFKSGQGLTNMHKLYFQGRYWVRLHNSPLIITYTPTNQEIGQPGEYHYKFWSWPMPKGIVRHPTKSRYVPASSLRRRAA